MAGDAEKSLAAGMNDHVTKPIDPDELFSALLRWIKPGSREVQVSTAEDSPGEDQKAADVTIPTISGIDTASGLRRVSDNKLLYRDLLRQFVFEFGGVRGELDNALAKWDEESALQLAHTVKSVAGNIGARKIQRAGGALEAALRSGETSTLPNLLEALTESLDPVIVSLREAGLDSEQPHGPAPNEEGTPGGLLALLSALEPHVRDGKPWPCRAVMEKINKLRWPETYENHVSELDWFIAEYRFQEAQATLKSLTENIQKEST